MLHIDWVSLQVLVRRLFRNPTSLVDVVVTLAFYALVAIVAVALITSDAEDPSWWSASAIAVPVHNWLGLPGAWLAALLVYIFGVMAYIIPLLMIYYIVAQQRLTLERIIALLMVPVLQAILLTAALQRPFIGGIVGRIGMYCLQHFFGQSAAACNSITLILSALVAATVTVATAGAIWHWLFFAARGIAQAIVHPVTQRWCWMPLLRLLRHGVQIISDAVSWVHALASGKLLRNDPALIMQELELERLQQFLAETERRRTVVPEPVLQAAQTVTITPAVTPLLWRLPAVAALAKNRPVAMKHDVASAQAAIIETKLLTFGIKGKITAVQQGPVITVYQYAPEADTKLSKISALSDDLALALQAFSVRIIAPIPGTAVVGIEVPNATRAAVLLSAIMAQETVVQQSRQMQLPVILGVDTTGNPLLLDLARAPHLLIAGSTGSGKSVCINTLLVSLLCYCDPSTVRLVLIDPKRLEMSAYADIPHLLQPIIHQPADAVAALQWIVAMMEERYQELAEAGVRDITQYRQQQEAQGIEPMPYVVVIIDELADLMMTASAAIESTIARIAQMARAAGIHLIVATQRPSVDVITGIIKVNFPSRIAFRVTAKVDSRTIIDAIGAEQLLGRGDMLLMLSTLPIVQRAHGAYVSDAEIHAVTAHWREQGRPEYQPLRVATAQEVDAGEDTVLMPQIELLLQELDEISISLLQRKLRIGFNRSARIIELLERQGKIAPHDGGKLRKVLR